MGTLAPTQKVVPDPVVQAAVPKPAPAKPSAPVQQAYVSMAPTAAPSQPVHHTPPPQRVSSSVQKPPSTAQRPVSERPGTIQQRPSSQRNVPPVATPRSGSQKQPAAARSARGSSDRSLAPPKRRWGLIIVVLLLDLGLAGAGVYLLMEGLATPEVITSPTTKVGAAPAPAPVAAKPVVAVEPKPEPKPEPKVEAKPEAKPDDKPVEPPKPPSDPMPKEDLGAAALLQGRKPKPTPTTTKKPRPPAQPVDPYQDPGPSLGPPPPPPPNTQGL